MKKVVDIRVGACHSIPVMQNKSNYILVNENMEVTGTVATLAEGKGIAYGAIMGPLWDAIKSAKGRRESTKLRWKREACHVF